MWSVVVSLKGTYDGNGCITVGSLVQSGGSTYKVSEQVSTEVMYGSVRVDVV